jgi:hypothetical protein
MPTVQRQNPNYVSAVRLRKEKVAWNDMTKPEVHKTSAKYARRAIGALVLTGAVGWLAGSPPHDRDMDKVIAAARQHATDDYLKMSTLQKYEAAYTNPYTVHESFVEGGHRVLKHIWGPSESYGLKVGQACLAGTAYDTSASRIEGRAANGNISAVAALAVEDGTVAVHPAGSNTVTLKFTEANGVLVPTAATSESLEANGCEPTSGVLTFEDKNYYAGYADELYGDWSKAKPILAP